jgi:hypothetical protein
MIGKHNPLICGLRQQVRNIYLLAVEATMNLEEKVVFLEGLGFEICHEVSNVEHSGFHFDLSATKMDPDAIIYTVIKKAYEEGQKCGKEDLQLKLRTMFGCDS